MKKILLVLMLGIFLISFVSAIDYTFPYNTEYDIKRPCFNNGTFCQSSFTCNVTYLYPDGSVVLDNVQMTRTATYYNVTITQSLNNKLGVYQGIMSCTDGTVSGGDTFEAEVTADGFKSIPFPWQFAIFGLGFILIASGKVNRDLSLFQTAGSVIIFLMGIITLYPGYSGINYSTLMGLGLGTIGIAGGGYFMIEGSLSRDKQVDTYDYQDDGRFHD
jgi:hypothetical protein